MPPDRGNTARHNSVVVNTDGLIRNTRQNAALNLSERNHGYSLLFALYLETASAVKRTTGDGCDGSADIDRYREKRVRSDKHGKRHMRHQPRFHWVSMSVMALHDMLHDFISRRPR